MLFGDSYNHKAVNLLLCLSWCAFCFVDARQLSTISTIKAGFFMTKQEIIDDLIRLHKINQANIAEQFRRVKAGQSKSVGGNLVQAVTGDHRLLVTIAKLEGHLDPNA